MQINKHHGTAQGAFESRSVPNNMFHSMSGKTHHRARSELIHPVRSGKLERSYTFSCVSPFGRHGVSTPKNEKTPVAI